MEDETAQRGEERRNVPVLFRVHRLSDLLSLSQCPSMQKRRASIRRRSMSVIYQPRRKRRKRREETIRDALEYCGSVCLLISSLPFLCPSKGAADISPFYINFFDSGLYVSLKEIGNELFSETC